MTTGPIYEDWGGDQIDLRQAEEHDIEEAELTSQGVAIGTESQGALTFTAPTALEILALRYRAQLSLTFATRDTTIPHSALRRRGKAFNITTRSNFGEGRDGDYLTEHVLASGSVVLSDDTNGTGAAHAGADGYYATLIDPGLDTVRGPLVLSEGEFLEVHLLQIANAAPSSPAEQTLRHRLEIWWEETPEAATEVRQRGDFPSGGSRTTV